jgi:hypothetical protein
MMRIGSERAIALALVIAGVSLIGVAVAAQGSGPLLAEQAFKNVQAPALKAISVDDFMLTMGIMTSSLGFDCADTPRKRTARRMVSMVQALNRDNFGGRQLVTCWTCHRNRDRPVATLTNFEILYGTPILESDDLVPASRPGMPAPNVVVDKYLQALGGAQKLSAMTSWAATGTSMGFGGFGGAGRVEIYAKAPEQRSTIIRFPSAPDRDASVRSFDGRTGWIKTPLSVLGEYQLSGSEFDGARLDAQLSFPGQITQVLTNLRTLDPVTIDGKACDVVQGDSQRRTFATLFFERSTGLLIRTIRFGPSPIGRIPTQIDYSDYRDVNGIQMPFRFTLSWLDGRDEVQLNQIQPNIPIDAAKFGRPIALESPR